MCSIVCAFNVLEENTTSIFRVIWRRQYVSQNNVKCLPYCTVWKPRKPHHEIHYHENANFHEGSNCFWCVKFNTILVVAEEQRPDIFFNSYKCTSSFIKFHIQMILLFSLFIAFFWVVMYSYYRQMEEEKIPNSGIVNCTYQIPNEQVQMLGVDGKVPRYSPKNWHQIWLKTLNAKQIML
jgi:hypothetical protein